VTGLTGPDVVLIVVAALSEPVVILAIVVHLAKTGFLTAQVKRPPETQARTGSRGRQSGPSSGPPMTAPPAAPRPGGADDYQTRSDAP
jgi:hypothetical protein